MKAVLFSNFPKDVFEHTFKPKFDLHNVEILEVLRTDRTSTVDLSQADVVIAMVELMSAGQRERIKGYAKKQNCQFLALSRKGAGWGKDFERIMKRTEAPSSVVLRTPEPKPLALVPPPPPSEPAPPSVPAVDFDTLTAPQLRAELDMFEKENVRLEETQDRLEKKIAELEAVVEFHSASSSTQAMKQLEQKYLATHEELHVARGALEKTKGERDQQVSETRKLKKKIEELEKSSVSKESFTKLSEQFDRTTSELNTVRTALQGAPNLEEFARRGEILEKVGNDSILLNQKIEALDNAFTRANAELLKADELTKKQGAELFHLKKENDRLKAAPPPEDTGELARVRIQLQKLKQDVAAAEPEMARTRESNSQLRAENEELKKKLVGRASVKSTEDFLKLREAFALVWRAGAMSDREVLEKLMNWQPKEGT